METLGQKIVNLRTKGKSYSEIRKIIGDGLSKSTISYWCKNLELTKNQRDRIQRIMERKIKIARLKALKTIREKRVLYLRSLFEENRFLKNILKNKRTAKLALVMLYFGEGGKTRKGSLMIGNSDPSLIRLFMKLLKTCYKIDESKFRCTVLCRADHNIKNLERFWSRVTGIPPSLFYKTRIDKRTIGQKSKKLDYKGVCRLEYFSANIFHDIMAGIKVLEEF